MTFIKANISVIMCFILCHTFTMASLHSQNNSCYGIDESLVNGKLYQNIYYKDKGHPFWMSKDAFIGTVTLHSVNYPNQKIYYNILDQKLILSHSINDDLWKVIPPIEFVSEFTINNTTFVKMDIINGVESFYEEVYHGTISCYYHWSKIRSEYHDDNNVVLHRISDPSRLSYLVFDNKVVRYKGNRSFLKAFPKEFIPKIKAYIKMAELDVVNCNKKEIANLLAYCATVVDKNTMGGTYE